MKEFIINLFFKKKKIKSTTILHGSLGAAEAIFEKNLYYLHGINSFFSPNFFNPGPLT